MFPNNGPSVATGSFKHPIPIPVSGVFDLPGACVQINVQWIPIIIGCLQQLLLKSTWQYSSLDELADVQGSAFDLIAAFGNAIGAGADMQCVQFQNSGDCGLQVSYDAGATWTTIFDPTLCISDTVTADIADGTLLAGNALDRVSGAYEPQWPSGSIPAGQSGQCLAAQNIAAAFESNWTDVKAALDAGKIAMEAVSIVAGALAIFVVVTGAVFEFLGIMIALFAAGDAAVSDIISETNLNILKCAIDQHCEDNGSFTTGDFSGVIGYVDSHITNTLTRSVYDLWLNTLGPVGLSRMAAAAGIVSGDCSSCADTFTHTFDFTASDCGWVPYDWPATQTPGPDYIGGQGWTCHLSGTDMWCFITKTGFTAEITSVKMFWHNGTAPGGAGNYVGIDDGSAGHNIFTNAAVSGDNTLEWTGDLSTSRLYNVISTEDNSDHPYITKCVVKGIGTDPF